MQHVGERARICSGELVHASQVAATAHQNLERPDGPERYQADESFIFENHSRLRCLLECNVIAQKAAATCFPIAVLGPKFFLRLSRNRCCRPDLAMRVRIARSHHATTVFEYLDVVDFLSGAEFTKLIDPDLDNAFNLPNLHGGKRQIVARREANDPADAGLALGDDQALLVDVEPRAVGTLLERGEIVVEYERCAVSRIAHAP